MATRTLSPYLARDLKAIFTNDFSVIYLTILSSRPIFLDL